MSDLQYITDSRGEKTGVILPLEDFEEMLEDFHFGEIARQSKNETQRDFNELLAEMRASGEIDV